MINTILDSLQLLLLTFSSLVFILDSESITPPTTVLGATAPSQSYYEAIESDGYFYILGMGQSNMYGNSRAADTTTADLTPINDVEVWNPATNSWEVGKISSTFDPVTGMDKGGNMAWFAAKELHQRTGVPVRIIVDTVGGRPIDDWVNNGRQSIRYKSAIDQLLAAQVPEVDLIIFAQGESNNNTSGVSSINTKTEYALAISQLLQQLRSEPMISTETRFVMPELVHIVNSTVKMYDRNDFIFDLNKDGDPVTFVARASGPGLSYPIVANDDVHWSLSGLELMGKRIINAYNTHKELGVLLTNPNSTISGLVIGSSKNEMFRGSNNDEIFFGLGGSDNIAGGRGLDYLFGGYGSDLLWSTYGHYVFGGPDNDTIGGVGTNDILHGGSGSDSISGSAGNDILIGGAGKDKFWFKENQGVDKIKDFEVNVDQIGFRTHSLYHAKMINDDISFNTFKSIYMFQNGYDTIISTTGKFNNNNTIILEGVNSVDLNVNNFIF